MISPSRKPFPVRNHLPSRKSSVTRSAMLLPGPVALPGNVCAFLRSPRGCEARDDPQGEPPLVAGATLRTSILWSMLHGAQDVSVRLVGGTNGGRAAT